MTKSKSKYVCICGKACKATLRYKACSEECKSEIYKQDGGVKCAICDYYAHDLTPHITRHHKMSIVEYQRLYCGDVNSEKMRNQKAAAFAADKNPGFQHGGKFSPFSTKFVGYTDESAEDKINSLKEHCVEVKKQRSTNPLTLEYYTSKGMSEREAEAALQERQATMSLARCIDRFGEEDGRAKMAARNAKWLATLDSKSPEEKLRINSAKISTKSISDISRTLFQQVAIDGDLWGDTELSVFSGGKIFRLDFCRSQKVIEFNGDFWHANPDKYNFDDFMYGEMNAEDIWLKDALRLHLIRKLGYEILVIWESEFKADPESVISKCKHFLENK